MHAFAAAAGQVYYRQYFGHFAAICVDQMSTEKLHSDIFWDTRNERNELQMQIILTLTTIMIIIFGSIVVSLILALSLFVTDTWTRNCSVSYFSITDRFRPIRMKSCLELDPEFLISEK